MEKLIYCRICGQQVSSKAKKCPHCGAKLKSSHILLKIIVGLIIFTIVGFISLNVITTFIGGLMINLGLKNQVNATDNTARNGVSSWMVQDQSAETRNNITSTAAKSKPTATVKTTQKPTAKPTQKPTIKPTQKPTIKPTPEPLPGIGIRIEEDGIAVTLTNVVEKSKGTYYNPEQGNVFILCEFVIENNTSEELTVSSLMSFSFYYDGFSAPLSLNALVEKGSANQLDGVIAPGKKFRGIVGYEIPKDWKELEVSFRPDVWYSSSFDYGVKYNEVKR